MVKIINIKITADKAGERADKFLSSENHDKSRTYFTKLIAEGKVFLNDKPFKPSTILKVADRLRYETVPTAKVASPKPEKIALDIIFENDQVIVINKQAGLVVHPAHGYESGTLINALVKHFPQIKKVVYDENSQVSLDRPGLVQRLDRDTSGVMIVAKNVASMKQLAHQIESRTVKKYYLGLCLGWPKESSGKLVSFLGRHPTKRTVISDIGKEKGRQAISNYHVVKYYQDKQHNKISLIQFQIMTGRTHQIRVQASRIGHPILGDFVYGNKISNNLSKQYGVNRQLLHSYILKINLPNDSKISIFQAPLPKDFENIQSKFQQI